MIEQIIVKGDDTFFNNTDLLGSITFITQLSLTGWSAKMYYQQVTLKFADISSKTIQPRFTKEQTKFFVTGTSYAKLALFDSNGNKRTEFTDLPYKVVDKVEGNYEQ